MQKYISNSEEETKQIARKITKETKSRFFALSGELGAGKTVFADFCFNPATPDPQNKKSSLSYRPL